MFVTLCLFYVCIKISECNYAIQCGRGGAEQGITGGTFPSVLPQPVLQEQKELTLARVMLRGVTLSQSDKCRKEKVVCDRHSLHRTPWGMFTLFILRNLYSKIRAGCAKLGPEVHALVSGRGGGDFKNKFCNKMHCRKTRYYRHT